MWYRVPDGATRFQLTISKPAYESGVHVDCIGRSLKIVDRARPSFWWEEHGTLTCEAELGFLMSSDPSAAVVQ